MQSPSAEEGAWLLPPALWKVLQGWRKDHGALLDRQAPPETHSRWGTLTLCPGPSQVRRERDSAHPHQLSPDRGVNKALPSSVPLRQERAQGSWAPFSLCQPSCLGVELLPKNLGVGRMEACSDCHIVQNSPE